MKTLTLVAIAILASVAGPTLLCGATITITKSVELQASSQTPIFTNSYSAGPTIPARGGGYFLVDFRTNGCALLRLAAAGNILWERAMPVCNSTFDLLEQEDGGVLALMGSRLLRFALDGTVTLDRAIVGGKFSDIVQHPDGFLLGGDLSPGPFQETVTVQLLTTNFDFVWQRFYPGTFVPYNLLPAASGGYTFGKRGGIVQIGTNGFVEIDRSFRGTVHPQGGDQFIGFSSVRAGGYLLLYGSATFPGFDKTAPYFVPAVKRGVTAQAWSRVGVGLCECFNFV